MYAENMVYIYSIHWAYASWWSRRLHSIHLFGIIVVANIVCRLLHLSSIADELESIVHDSKTPNNRKTRHCTAIKSD